MGARKLLYRLLVISPMALIAWIVGTGRFTADNFEFAGATTSQHKAISAYREVVRLTTPLRARTYQSDPAQVRFIANQWIEGHLSGRLKPLTPAYLGDTVQNGVKGEIRSCQAALTVQLHLIAGREARSGDVTSALADMKTSLMVSQVLRSSDPLAESACCQEQALTITRLRPLLPRLDSDQLAALQMELRQLRDAAPSLERLIRQTAVLMQQSQPQLTLVEKWGTVIASAKPKGTMSLRLSDYMATKPKSTRGMPAPIAQLYLGIRARDGLNHEIEALSQEISVLLNPKKSIGGTGDLSQFSL